MKKIFILMLTLTVSMLVSAQKKMTIKTGNGQTVEISCDGISPKEIAVASDGTVTFKMEMGKETTPNVKTEKSAKTAEIESEEADSTDTFVEVDSLVEARPQVTDSLETDALVADSLYGSDSQQTALGFIANTLAEELSPEYAAFEKEHEGTHPGTERELTKRLAKNFFSEEDVETADALATLFSGIRFTKDSTFIPTYEQRKPSPSLRVYDDIRLSGSLGQNISGISDAVAGEISEDDYGDDAENHNKIGGGVEYSRAYLLGKEIDGKWQQHPIGFGWSWGGLVSYSYEKEIGSYVNIMGKAGIQIGRDICVGVDALVGAGVTPYNTFISNGINYNTVNKSVWCFKYGVQLWGSLNFSKDTYTAFFGRYIRSVKPNEGDYTFSGDWEVELEDFDPSSWTVGLAVGYKFGTPEKLSPDKRLQASINTGYYFVGNKGMYVSTELERLTQVSKSTTLSYGLTAENAFDKKEKGGDCSSLMLSAGFNVCQPHNSWFWGAKIFGGVGEYPAINVGNVRGSYKVEDFCNKLCIKGALQLTTGFKIGKCSTIYCNLRAGYHSGQEMQFDNFDDASTENIKGFDLGAGLGCSFTF